MIKLRFVPEFFPIVLLPLWWVFLLCFYVVYLPVYLLVLLFSPWRSRKSLVAFYSRKASEDKREVRYSDSGKEDAKKGDAGKDGKEGDDGDMEDDLP